ncbi:interleukin-31 receptor subunit alpha [Cheilinus undulatus]|uniref:interleukin-31 receptor subunit alpha n=1 Tax=Cheilinus undulatus TaxID=241271 RepID=UPI001BD4723A|nr:interleukin-31 receptor subunit alpha [Cheilinus undulatus]
MFMEQRPALMWTFLLGAALALVFPPAGSFNTSKADPRQPELIRCEFLHRANVTCYWKLGSALSSHNTLQVQRLPWTHKVNISRKSPLTTFSCTTSGTSCTAALNGSSVRFEFCTTVTAQGPSWNESSQNRCQSGRLEVILPPVTLDVKPVSGKPKCLNVTWSNSDFPVSLKEIRAGHLTSQIQFAAQGQLDFQVQNVIVRDYSMLVCLFRPDTSYSIRLRHQFLAAGNETVHKYPELYWSPWSNETWGRTVMDAPALWRQIKQTEQNGWRNISLLWQANGRVRSYNVTCHTESSLVLEDHGSCKNLHSLSTSCSLLLPNGCCSCALTAFTSEGFSPEARTWFLGVSESEPPPPNNLTVRPLDDSSLDVRWTAPVGLPAKGYVVEWFAMTESNNSILHWETLNSSCTAFVITEGVKALERYTVSVRVLYGERGAGQNRMVQVYTRQGAPSSGPTVVVKQISGRTVELTWSPVPVEMRHGFIRSYVLYFITANQPTGRKGLSADAHSDSLRDLLPGNYDIFMKAITDAGAGEPGPVTKVHIGGQDTQKKQKL